MPPKRRAAYGTGTKPALRADGMWVARIEAGYTATGTRKRIVVSAKTEAECRRRLKERQRELATGRNRGIDARKTVQAWSKEWLPIHAKKVRPTTYTTDAGTIRKWIVPTIGHRRLDELSPADLRALRDAITGAGRSTTTAAHAHRVLRKMLRDALVEGYAVQQRIFEVEAPQKAASDRTAMPLEHALKILAVTDRRDDRARWTAGLLMGIRSGEVRGLTWDAIDLNEGLMDISWQVQHLTEGHETPDGWEARHLTGRAWLTRPKTSAGTRIVPMVESLHAQLVKARAEWTPNPWGLIWVNERRLPIPKEEHLATFHAIQSEAKVKHPSGRPWHAHEMRHFAISYLLARGVDRAIIERIVGQSKLVESYVHISHEQLREAIEQSAVGLMLEAPRQIEA
jgi:site-specific recombinase XerD